MFPRLARTVVRRGGAAIRQLGRGNVRGAIRAIGGRGARGGVLRSH